MKTMAAAKFKEKCLAILDSVDAEGIIITKHGKPVAKLVPIQAESGAMIGTLRGRLRIKGDLTTTELRWDAQS
jgi:prevent-host-death family protein